MQMMNREEWLAVLSGQKTLNHTAEQKTQIAELFPNIDPGVKPFGQRVLVQLRLARKRTKGGLYLPQDTQDTERWNEAVAQLIATGPLAFKKRDTLQPWGEGEWAWIGDFIRVPRWGGDRWEVPIPGSDPVESVMFAMFNDYEIIGLLTGNPVDMKVYV